MHSSRLRGTVEYEKAIGVGAYFSTSVGLCHGYPRNNRFNTLPFGFRGNGSLRKLTKSGVL